MCGEAQVGVWTINRDGQNTNLALLSLHAACQTVSLRLSSCFRFSQILVMSTYFPSVINELALTAAGCVGRTIV